MEKINLILGKITTFCFSAPMVLVIFIAYAELTNSTAIANTGEPAKQVTQAVQKPTKTAAKPNAEAKKEAKKTTPAAAASGGFSVKVEVTEAIGENFENSINSVGTLVSSESAEIKSEISGKIISAPFVNGNFIKAGKTLFIIENSIQQAELAKALAKQTLWQNNISRYNKLVASGAVSKFQLDDANANLKIAQAEAAYARAVLNKTYIKAPFDGVIGIRRVSVGEYITPEKTLTNIDQNRVLKLQFSVPEKFAGSLSVGNEVMFETAKYPNLKMNAKITSIDSRVDPKTRGLMIEALFDNSSGKLSSGQFANIFVSLAKNTNSISIPSQALIPMGNKNFIYKIIDGKAERYEVKIGNRNIDKVEILEGINVGEIIVTAGHQKLKPSTPVRVSEPSIVELSYMGEEKPLEK